MKHRILLSAVGIAGFAAFAAARQTPAISSSDRDQPVTTQQQTTQMTTTEAAPMNDMSGAAVTGTVRTYEAGRSVTIVRPDGTAVTYTINPESQLPPDIAVGKKVTVTTTTVSGSSQPVVQRIVVTKTTKTVEPPH